jgi:hypothetical protein
MNNYVTNIQKKSLFLQNYHQEKQHHFSKNNNINAKDSELK